MVPIPESLFDIAAALPRTVLAWPARSSDEQRSFGKPKGALWPTGCYNRMVSSLLVVGFRHRAREVVAIMRNDRASAKQAR